MNFSPWLPSPTTTATQSRPLQSAPPAPAGEDRRTAAARCLGELVRKMGERVLHRMLPILRDSMGSDSAAKRQVRRVALAKCSCVQQLAATLLRTPLHMALNSTHITHACTPQGVCAGLREVLEATTRHQLGEHLPDILPPIQAALCDTDAAVREAAGAAFGVLFRGGVWRCAALRLVRC